LDRSQGERVERLPKLVVSKAQNADFSLGFLLQCFQGKPSARTCPARPCWFLGSQKSAGVKGESCNCCVRIGADDATHGKGPGQVIAIKLTEYPNSLPWAQQRK